MNTDMSGRVALVTGASRGIGLGIARALLDAGVCVCLTARKQGELDDAVAHLGGGDRVITSCGSTDDAEHRRDAVAATVDAFGSLDVLVNNAATNRQFGPLVDAALDGVRSTVEANTVAPLAWVQEAWRAWMSAHGGSILNISSVGATRAGGFVGAYNISKAALQHLTRQLALELAPEVRVNALSLGLVRTKFSRALLENGEDEIISRHPMKRLGLPEDIADAALFLLSDRASWITGQVLIVDGGGTSLGNVTDAVTDHLPFTTGRN